jgi:hypothetical protein
MDRDVPHIFTNGNPTRYNHLFCPDYLGHFNILGGSIAQIIKNALKSNIWHFFDAPPPAISHHLSGFSFH